MFSKLNPTTIKTSGATSASFQLSLAPGQSKELEVTIYASPNDGGALDFATGKRAAENRFADWSRQGATVTSDNPHFNLMLERGLRDIYMLKQSTAGGEAIAAGTPWFAAPFGRDQLIVSLQMLPYRPEIARNVLRLLAAYQGTKDDPTKAEKPGKIMHELRIGEMARMKEIPFTPYYGTVDATPLWVMLLGRYYEQTGDNALVEELRPQLDRALDYLARETAATGYLTYGGMGKEALSNQGWKDSGDSVMYANGRLAQAPIALSEVQGYLYGAWLQAAKLHRKLYGRHSAAHLYRRAADLEERFDRDFWLTQKNCYALALDGAGKQVDVVSSNPGHLLMTSLGRTAHLRATADRLMQSDMFSGFGIKTLSSKESRHFNNSYHNGSVWPHDVSIIAGGMHGTNPDKSKIAADSLIAAARYQSGMRLPELYGGYKREHISVPIPYPVACEPQAWAAATPYMLVTAYLGLRADSERNTLVIDRPRLPVNTSRLSITNLEVNGKRVNLQFAERNGVVQTQVMANPDKLNISIKQ
jgi:glycogen debranching enzyme